MRITGLLLTLSAFVAAAAAIAVPESSPVKRAVSSVTIFSPPSSYKIPRTLYARTLVSSDGILATWENYSEEPPYFPVYKSTDGGASWKQLSTVRDTQNGWGLRYQPFLYELPQAIGSFPAGTILMSGSSIPSDLSITQIELYASRDRGKTWSFVSHIARGGVAQPNNGETPVWEPFLMVYNNQLVVYYSDQRDPKHGQKLVHQVSSDLYSWGSVVDDVAESAYARRPGMTTIAKLPNGKYILTNECNCGTTGGFDIMYRLADNPLNFINSPQQIIRATDGTYPTSSPYVIWTSAGGTNGTIVVSANSHSEVFVNKALGAPGSAWTKVSTPERQSYTRSLAVMQDPKQILIAGGGVLSGTANKVTDSVITVS